MTEKERELELYNRQERLEAMKIRKELGKKLQDERKKQSKKKDKEKKHHNKSVEKEDSENENNENNDNNDQYSNSIASRKSERKKGGDDNKKSALDVLKQKRIQKIEREKMEQSKKELLTTKDVYSDDESDEKGIILNYFRQHVIALLCSSWLEVDKKWSNCHDIIYLLN